MSAVPLGGLFFAFCTLVAVAPIRHPRPLAVATFVCSAAPNELPILFLAIVVVSSAPSVLDGGGEPVALAMAFATVAGLVVVLRRSLKAHDVTEEALQQALGPGREVALDAELTGRGRKHLPWLRVLFFPWPIRPRAIERVADIPYGDLGVENRLDVYRHRAHPLNSPTLIYLHGGRFRWGRKSFEARPLIYHLAGRGWTCISANYRRSRTPAAGFPGHLIDVKRVIAWARTDGRRHGVDPDMLVMAGSSAGAHLTAMAGLTANEPALQPGFEAADTSIAAGIGLYGYYGSLGNPDGPATTPSAYVNPAAPPFFILHGDHDTYTPVEGARRFVADLRDGSRQPVVYAELPGAQHSFDVFHSIRFETAVGAIDAFTRWVRTQHGRGSSAVRGESRRSR